MAIFSDETFGKLNEPLVLTLHPGQGSQTFLVCAGEFHASSVVDFFKKILVNTLYSSTTLEMSIKS